MASTEKSESENENEELASLLNTYSLFLCFIFFMSFLFRTHTLLLSLSHPIIWYYYLKCGQLIFESPKAIVIFFFLVECCCRCSCYLSSAHFLGTCAPYIQQSDTLTLRYVGLFHASWTFSCAIIVIIVVRHNIVCVYSCFGWLESSLKALLRQVKCWLQQLYNIILIIAMVMTLSDARFKPYIV